MNYLRDRKQCVVIDSKFSNFSAVHSGVPQGSILGPLLFILFINDISNIIHSDSHILLYADDMKVLRDIESINDQEKLQEDINALYNWSVANKMKFHPKKCSVLRVTLKNQPFLYTYRLANDILEMSVNVKDLGIIITNKLKWPNHHSNLLSKASQKLGLLKRSCAFTKNMQYRKILFLAIIRSQFEHCSSIWTPNSSQLLKFELLQKRGIKWIHDEDYCSYTKQMYHQKLKNLDIMPLELKFLLNDLVLFHNIVYNVSVIKMPEYLISAADIENNEVRGENRFFQRQTRNYNETDKLKFKSKITPKVNAFSQSFFYCTFQE